MVEKYRKKPVVIEAEQFVWSEENTNVSVHGVSLPIQHDDNGYYLIIPTLEGNMRANNEDYIIKGVQGEVYPCKPDIFEKTYEKVVE